MLKTAFVLETDNLHGGGADPLRVSKSLARLLAHLAKDLATVDEVVVTHEGLVGEDDLARAAGRDVRFVRVPDATGYYESKNLGFAATSADVVAFGDADCWPDPEWLSHLFAPFADPNVEVVAGRTTYRRDLLGTAASTLDFLYYTDPTTPGCVRNFYANNVAFRRAAFADRRYPEGAMYRGQCQLLGLRLASDGIAIHFEPAARTIHRFPDHTRQLLGLRIRRGQDTAAFSPHLARAFAPRWPLLVNPATVLGVRFVKSVGSMDALDMPPVRGLRRAACLGAITGLSLVDAVGALAGSLGWQASRESLAYHGDGDGLGSS